MGNCSTLVLDPSRASVMLSKATTESDPDSTHLSLQSTLLSPVFVMSNGAEDGTLPRVSDLVSIPASSPSPTSTAANRKTAQPLRRMSRITHNAVNAKSPHVRDIITHVLGQKKDQDRAVCVPELLPGVLYAGVFDGHGKDGEIRSELATTELPRLIKRELEQRPVLGECALHEALDSSYASFHKDLDQLYEDTVFRQAVARAKEEYAGENIAEEDVIMPQDGGTTATSVLVCEDLLVVGWVGDSRAVLCRRNPTLSKNRNSLLNRFSNRLKVSPLTEDHNVAANNSAEMSRVAEQGGEIFGRHLAAERAQGMLQLTRSLGDSPFHRTGLVVSKPGVVTIPLQNERGNTNDPLLFLLVASDGLWDYFSNKDASAFVYKRLKRENYADRTLGEKERGDILMETARALERECVKRCAERKSHSDDITVLILTFAHGWDLEAEELPNF